jgi:hypothetical protein
MYPTLSLSRDLLTNPKKHQLKKPKPTKQLQKNTFPRDEALQNGEAFLALQRKENHDLKRLQY